MFFRSVIFASVVSCALENFVLKPRVSRQEEYRSKLNGGLKSCESIFSLNV